ncbi:hypothetical protein QFZ72_004336 [Bacillus sp. V2I10]|jgi:hypothetical protein|nr:hypothetical protein [Bacillus sp. V2I10]
MPKWLNNTLYVLVLIVSIGCVSHGFEWKK